jgi:hypothetical protein
MTHFRRNLWAKHAQSIIKAIAFPFMILACFSIYGMARFGSIPKAVASLRGENLIADELSKIVNVDSGKPFSIDYTITNLTFSPIKLIGANMSCSCTSIDDLPLTIAPSKSRTIKVNVNAPGGESNFSGQVELFTDDPHRRTLVLAFVARTNRRNGQIIQASANPL